jgi:LuxR family transcriptional regulator, maltose regulon positive regulatory protein
MQIAMNLTKTRLRPPNRVAGLIPRKQLDAIVTRIPNRRLVFVKAPAGYGKSSQLHRWYTTLAADDALIGWLSIDRSIDDLRTLFFYIASSIREQEPAFGSEFLAFLDSSRDPTVERVTSAFVNELFETSRQVFLFVDDMHLLTDDSAKRALETVLHDAPRNFHLVVASRQSLPFSLARLRMLGEIDEIDVEQLKFNAEDITDFIQLSGREPLPDEAVGQLLAATEGWAAGVQLATISISQHDGVGQFLDRFTGENRAVSEYLLDDVIDRLPDATVEFLLKTSILEIFSEELCDFVVGNHESGEQIRDLSAQSLFIFSLDEEQNWFRYHHLFSELLQRILRKRAPDSIRGLHQKASEWFAANKQIDLAFSHAVKAEDWLAAATILESSCNDLFYGGKLSTLIKWADAIPPEVRANFPRLQLEIAWSIILEWRFDDAARIIKGIEDKIAGWRAEGKRPDYVETISRIVLHRKMMLALFSDDMPTVERYVLELLHDFPSEDPYLRGTLENCLIYARREMFKLDNVDKMDRWARDFFERSGSKFVMVWHESILAPTYHLRGDTDLAENALVSAIEIAEYVDGPCTPLQAMPAMLLAEIKYEKNEIEAAEALVSRFGQHAEKQGFVDHLAAYYVTRARLLQRAGKFDEAAKVIAEGRGTAEFRGFTRLARRLDYEATCLAARSGDLAALQRTLEWSALPSERPRLTPGQHSISYDEQCVLGWQYACSQLGSPRDAIGVLRKWVSFAVDRGAVRSEVRFLIALSLCLSLAGEEGEALRKMRSAVQKALKPRYLRSFIDGGEPVLLLLRKLFSEGLEGTGPVGEFGRELIAGFSGESASGSPTSALVPLQENNESEHAPPESLSERERDILRLVAWEKSNKEIARTLGMTEGTVKWYMQQVFLKMDVRRRSTAVRRARQFGML